MRNFTRAQLVRGARGAMAVMLALLVAHAAALPLSADDAPASAVGRRIADFSLDDFHGKTWSLADFDDRQLVVVVFLGTECPLVKLYAARLAEMADRYQTRGVAFVGINSNQQDALSEIAHFARVHHIRFPLLKDAGNKVADLFAAQRTPEVYVLGGAPRDRRVRYHGRIDDQYTYGLQRSRADRHDLQTALDELLAGQPVSVAETEAVGCHIGRLLEPRADSPVTYSRQISRLLQRRCVECHRQGEIGPFSLTSYDEVVGWAEMIAEVVREQRMPPWHANPQYGHFANDARLTAEEKQLIEQWVAAGAPPGDPAELPPPREFFTGWRIGKPDLVVYMDDEPFAVPATGEVPYKYFTVDPGFEEDRWVQAAECRPGNRAVVHHIIVAAASRDRLEARIHGELASDWLAATAPGARPMILPEGMAKLVPAGSKLIFQMHYTPNGTPQQDRSCIGLIFADADTVRKRVVTQKAAQPKLRIPPGEPNHEVRARYRFDEDALLLALFPHMHLRGKSFRYTAIYPDGRDPEILLDVPRYDFNWQNSYEYGQPKEMPAGTVLECVAHYDNSADNLANPDPTQWVRWGDQTWEEMMIGYFSMTPAAEDLTRRDKPGRRSDEFLAARSSGNWQLPPRLPDQAAGALASNEALEDWAAELRRAVPQLDRVDWMTLADGKLTIRRVAQEGRIRRHAAAGISVPAQSLRLAEYARRSEVVVHPQTASVPAPDFRLMSRLFASSLHVPTKIDGVPGVISFWSHEEKAFPDAAVEVLTPLAKALQP